MSISLQKLRKRTPPPPESGEKRVKKSNRFDGLSEEEVVKINNIKDILENNLDLVFVGINPSLTAAYTGKYYAGPGNHFYKLLYESKLIPEPITYEADVRLLEYKIGLTNIVTRPSRSSADLTKTEMKKGGLIVHDKLKKFKPKIAVFNGKCIYEEFADKYDKSKFRFGLQPAKVGETALWVVPSSSARCANFPRMQDKLHFYTSLKKYLAYLKGEITEINLEEFSFEGKCKQAVPSTSKMWRRKSLSAFANGGRVVNKETFDMDTSMEGLAVPRSMEFIIKTYEKEEKDGVEKDSSIASSQSDLELPQNKQVEPKRKRTTQKVKEEILERKRISANINRDPSKTIDFVSLIKAKINNKEQNSEEKTDKLSEKQQNTESKKLKFGNLSPKKSKLNFKLEKFKNVN